MPEVNGRYYDQETPREQIKMILFNSLRGHIDNLKAGIITIEKFSNYFDKESESILHVMGNVSDLNMWPSEDEQKEKQYNTLALIEQMWKES